MNLYKGSCYIFSINLNALLLASRQTKNITTKIVKRNKPIAVTVVGGVDYLNGEE